METNVPMDRNAVRKSKAKSRLAQWPKSARLSVLRWMDLGRKLRWVGSSSQDVMAKASETSAEPKSAQRHVETSTTTIRFAEASEADIEAYARSGEPLECAGAFTLEAMGGWFIDSIDGDPSSVIGLSLPVVRRALYSFGLGVSDFW